jgi:erythromycin esterase-like protein
MVTTHLGTQEHPSEKTDEHRYEAVLAAVEAAAAHREATAPTTPTEWTWISEPAEAAVPQPHVRQESWSARFDALIWALAGAKMHGG